MAALALALGAAPVAAQDAPLIDFDGALNDARVTGRMVRQAQERGQTAGRKRHVTPGQSQACAKKEAFRRQFGASNAKVRSCMACAAGLGFDRALRLMEVGA